MSEPENFAEHPQSIAEIKANKADSCALWGIRDALIAALRAIDSGELKADNGIVCIIGKLEDGMTKATFFNACSDIYQAQGLINRCGYILNDTP